MEEELKQLLESIIDEMNLVHSMCIKVQNSGLVDDYEFSEITMMADDFREKIIIFKENVDLKTNQGGDG